jgi:hypothetical protein
VHLDALIDERDDLVLEGQDTGTASGQVFGTSGYAYWLTVAADHKERLLVELVAALFRATSMTTSAYRRWLEDPGIPVTFYAR